MFLFLVSRKNVFEIKIYTVKSRNYESRYTGNDKSHYYDRLCDDTVMETSIEKSRYYEKSRYKDGLSADRNPVS